MSNLLLAFQEQYNDLGGGATGFVTILGGFHEMLLHDHENSIHGELMIISHSPHLLWIRSI